jgi:hypothetical protein
LSAQSFDGNVLHSNPDRADMELHESIEVLDRTQLIVGCATAFGILADRARAMVPRRESMEATWWATSGTLSAPRSYVSEKDAGAIARATSMLQLASKPGTVWGVLRAPRGGVE